MSVIIDDYEKEIAGLVEVVLTNEGYETLKFYNSNASGNDECCKSATITNLPSDFFRMSKSQLEKLSEKVSDALFTKYINIKLRSDGEILALFN